MPIQKDPERIEVQYLHQLVDFSRKHVLEIGCGDGRLTWRYGVAAARVIGIDPDAEALLAATRECPTDLRGSVSFARASSLNLPFPRDTFDIAILAWSL
jgi:ubiquinone/menaquinone biosynthesis C-methylase UbiE